MFHAICNIRFIKTITINKSLVMVYFLVLCMAHNVWQKEMLHQARNKLFQIFCFHLSLLGWNGPLSWEKICWINIPALLESIKRCRLFKIGLCFFKICICDAEKLSFIKDNYVIISLIKAPSVLLKFRRGISKEVWYWNN